MKQQACPKCRKDHDLYYLIKVNNTRAMFMLCPKMKSEGSVFTLWLPLVDNLEIPSFLSGSTAYEELKASVRVDGEYSEEEKRVLSAWRTARLFASRMTPSQLQLIKTYVKGTIRW